MNTDVILSFVRQTLTFIGGIFVAKGTISAETMTALVTSLSTVIGGSIALASIYWSWRTHIRRPEVGGSTEVPLASGKALAKPVI